MDAGVLTKMNLIGPARYDFGDQLQNFSHEMRRAPIRRMVIILLTIIFSIYRAKTLSDKRSTAVCNGISMLKRDCRFNDVPKWYPDIRIRDYGVSRLGLRVANLY